MTKQISEKQLQRLAGGAAGVVQEFFNVAPRPGEIPGGAAEIGTSNPTAQLD